MRGCPRFPALPEHLALLEPAAPRAWVYTFFTSYAVQELQYGEKSRICHGTTDLLLRQVL